MQTYYGNNGRRSTYTNGKVALRGVFSREGTCTRPVPFHRKFPLAGRKRCGRRRKRWRKTARGGCRKKEGRGFSFFFPTKRAVSLRKFFTSIRSTFCRGDQIVTLRLKFPQLFQIVKFFGEFRFLERHDDVKVGIFFFFWLVFGVSRGKLDFLNCV